ncbi:unnamed protein product [Pseudo-nitzschia multistriata]|uniref:Phosphoglycerate mutase family protein n=1 Tax=Pseudo-nitzschia multistriata TaxID=183589 RepID=A0A448ZEP2_9STRA|nr:unnamed protein product [Pseudo-nitzschia multistriata]
MVVVRNIELYVVRHGERQDEAIRREFRSWQAAKTHHRRSIERGTPALPATDSLDPPLTARGHRQAHAAFSRLFGVLRRGDGPRRIAVVCSPLRRAVGTALMIGTVGVDAGQSGNGEPLLEFPRHRSGANSDGHDGAIPITVLNGLGNSAAAVSKRGGMEELVPKGFIRCAGMGSNDGTDASPLARALSSMPVHRQQNEPCAQHSGGKPIRFWKRHEDKTGKSWLSSPVSKPLRPVVPDEDQRGGNDGFSYPSRQSPRGTPLLPPKNPLSAVDEAVAMAADRRCNVCIVVAHRETIRDLAAERCGYFGSLSTPYCCVGSFGVSLIAGAEGGRAGVGEDSGATCAKYHFHNVWSTETFGTQAIPRHFPSPPTNSSSSSCSVVFLVSGEIGSPHCVCTIRSNLQKGELGSQVWLSDAEEPTLRRDLRKRTKTEGFCLETKILTGREEWEQLLTRQTGGVLKGWTGWQLPDGRIKILQLETNTMIGRPSATIEWIIRIIL